MDTVEEKQEWFPTPLALLVGYALIVGTTLWGWLHWRADLDALTPPFMVVAWIAPLMAVLWTMATLLAARADGSGGVKKAVGLALAAHVPFTLVALSTSLSGLWIALMGLASGKALLATSRTIPGMGLVGLPYIAWLAAASLISFLDAPASL